MQAATRAGTARGIVVSLTIAVLAAVLALAAPSKQQVPGISGG